MDIAWLEIAGFAVRAPVNAGTNLILAAQCILYQNLLRKDPSPRSQLWAAFFTVMAMATLAGVAKHALRHVMPEAALLTVLWVSNLGGGLSTYFAQRATIASGRAAQRVELERMVLFQLLSFLAANMMLGPEIILLILNTALGLLPVIVIEARWAVRGRASGAWVAGGLALSILTGVVYLTGVSVGSWFNHIDIAHVFMGVSFYLILRGSRHVPLPSADHDFRDARYVFADGSARQADDGSTHLRPDIVQAPGDEPGRPGRGSSAREGFSWT